MVQLSTTPLQSNLSTRVSLRWLPEPPFENTDTIVCQVGEWYVDLRIDTETGELDWALAGQYLSEGKNPRHVTFTHEIDSHHNFNVSQPCPFYPLPSGCELETGTMGRPDKEGTPATDYEEVWRYLPRHQAPKKSEHGISWILESDDDVLREGQNQVVKVFLARIGDDFLVLQQHKTHTITRISKGEWAVKVTGGEVSARREHFNLGWKEKYAVGPRSNDLPSMIKGFPGEGEGSWCIPGGKVNLEGRRYVVRAFERWRPY